MTTIPGSSAVITGAASGIGRATALAFSREGAKVVAADISENGNQETARLIEEQGGRAIAVRCDVTKSPEIIFTAGQHQYAGICLSS